MKKTITFILAICLCLFAVPLFVACEQEENKYWLATDTKYEEFVTVELPKYTGGFDFGTKINTNITNGFATYGELDTIYTPVFKVSIGFLEQYKDCFALEPINKNKQVEQQFANLNEKIDTLTASLNNFKTTDIPTFVEGVKGTSQEDAESIISKQFLKEFKRKYINLSTEVLSFAEDLLKLYTSAYQDIPALYDGTNYVQLTDSEIENYSRLALSKTIIYSLLPAIDYINSFTDGKNSNGYIKYERDFYIEIINAYEDIIDAKNKTTATAEKLYAFDYTFKAYQNDVEIFKKALASIDMPTLSGPDYNFDAFAYSKGNSQNYANATKVLLFSENSMYILKDKLVNLYN